MSHLVHALPWTHRDRSSFIFDRCGRSEKWLLGRSLEAIPSSRTHDRRSQGLHCTTRGQCKPKVLRSDSSKTGNQTNANFDC